VIIGDGPDVNQYKELARKLRVQDSVIFTGKVSWDEIPKYYQLADVFATASRTETQGLTVIEAMAASIPVVAADDESFKSVIIDGLNGFLFANKKEYKKQVRKLMEDTTLRKRMSDQARISAEPHSAKYFAEKVLDVYQTALEGAGAHKRSFFGKAKHVVKKGFYGK